MTSFTAPNGEAVEATSQWGQLLPVRIGSAVTVLYDPAVPSVVGIDGHLPAESEPALRLTAGIAAIAFGLASIVDPGFTD